MESNKILFTGDPILDVYIDSYNTMHTYKGGALNIYQNTLALLEESLSKECANFKFAYPNDGDCTVGDIFNFYTIVRTPRHVNGVPLISENEKTIFYEPSGIAETINEFRPNIVVYGDYNKGALSSFYDLTLPKIDISIVDSRYKSIHPSWLSTSKLKMWHATGDEYDKEWAQQFDIVFWTDGPEDVRVIKENDLVATLSVPTDTKVIDSCGSGDTFTATIAACLYAYKNTSTESIIDYAEYAIQVCQSVVSKPHTATTDMRIKR